MISKRKALQTIVALIALAALAALAALSYAGIVMYQQHTGGRAPCVQGYVHFVDSNGNARQILNTAGNGVPCAKASQ